MKRYCIGLYEKAMPDTLPWFEKLRCAKDCGYDYVEISIDESEARLARLEWSQGERSKLRSVMDDTGMPIRSMCLSGHRKYPLGSADPAIRRRGLEIMEKALELADDLGIRMIQLAGYDVYYEKSTAETRKLFADNIHQAVDMAAAYGILMGFETMETTFMDTVGKSMDFVRAADSPYLGVYPDIGNLMNAAVLYGTDVVADLQKGAGNLIAMHLKPTKPGQYRDIFFDDPDQHVNFDTTIAAAWNLGVRRYVTELWHLGFPDWKNHIQTANLNMCRVLDSIEKEEAE